MSSSRNPRSLGQGGCQPGDILIVDKSVKAQHNDIVIASVHGELTAKQLILRPQVQLNACNEAYDPIIIKDGMELEIFGVVQFSIRCLRKT